MTSLLLLSYNICCTSFRIYRLYSDWIRSWKDYSYQRNNAIFLFDIMLN